MTISLPSDLQPFVDQLVAKGSNPSADAVVSDAVRRLRGSQIHFEELKASFDEAVAELRRAQNWIYFKFGLSFLLMGKASQTAQSI